MTDWEIKDLQAISFDGQDRSEFRYSRKNPTTASVVIDLKDEQSGVVFPAVDHEDNIEPTPNLKKVTIKHLAALPLGYKVIATLFDAASKPKDYATAKVESGILIERRAKKKAPPEVKAKAKRSPSSPTKSTKRPATSKKSKSPLKIAKKTSTR